MKPTQDFNFKRWVWPITYGILLFFLLQNIGRIFNLADGMMGLLSPIVIGFFIAFILNIPMRAIERGLVNRFLVRKELPSLRRTISILLTLLVVILLFTVIVRYVGPQLTDSVMLLGRQMPGYMNEVQKWVTDISQNVELPAEVATKLTTYFNDALQWLLNFLTDFVPKLIGGVVGFASSLINVFMGLVFALYMLFNKEKMVRGVKKLTAALLPENIFRKVHDVAALTNNTFNGYFTGQLTEAFVLGGLCFLGMSIFRFPYAPLISVIVGVTALIPILGADLGAIPSAFLILIESPIKALWFVIFIVCLQQLEGSLIYPRIVGSSIGLTGFWVMAALIVGGGIAGIPGVIIGVPACSVLYTLTSKKTNEVLKKKQLDIR